MMPTGDEKDVELFFTNNPHLPLDGSFVYDFVLYEPDEESQWSPSVESVAESPVSESTSHSSMSSSSSTISSTSTVESNNNDDLGRTQAISLLDLNFDDFDDNLSFTSESLDPNFLMTLSDEDLSEDGSLLLITKEATPAINNRVC